MGRVVLFSLMMFLAGSPSAQAAASGICGYAEPPLATLYNPSHIQTIDATVSHAVLRGTRVLLVVRTRDEAGHVQRWAVDWASACRLAGEHLTILTLRPGDRVRIAGASSRNPAVRLMWARSIVRPADRWNWSLLGD